jgi:hypothetical protein
MEQVLRFHGRGDLPVELAGALGSASEQAVQCARGAMATHANRRRNRRGERRLDATPHYCARGFLRTIARRRHQAGRDRVRAASLGLIPESNESIVRLFQSDRSREYDEFAERCAAFLNEINQCRRALRGFSQTVYKVEGMQESAAGWDYPNTLAPEPEER